MKRFLKHNRYELDDRDRESLWHEIRRELKPGASERTSWMPSFRPTLVAVTTVATLAALGVWWIDSNQTDKIMDSHPGLLAEGPAEVTRQALTPVEESTPQVREEKMTLTQSVAEPEAKETPRGAPAEDRDEAPEALDRAAAPPTMATTDMGREKSQVRAAVPTGVSLTGRVLDPETGDGLAYANVLIRGTTRGVAADSSGTFRLDHLQPGQEITLVISVLGYAQYEQVVTVPQDGPFEYAFNLEPVSVETLEPFDVAVAENIAEVESAVPEHKVGSETFQKYSTDSVDDALSKNSGVVMRAGELHQAPSSAEEAAKRAQPTRDGTWGSGSVTGGTKPPNDEQVELMYFEHVGVNPFVATEDDALSTFAVDVDNASWTVARNYLSQGIMPPQDAIRVEEFVNAFDPGWERHTDETFRLHSDGSPSRFGAGYHLLRIGVVGRSIEDKNRKAANLIFVIDISGSMNRENRLGAVKKSLRILLDELGEGDRVGLVVYGSQGEVRLEPTDISRREVIMQAIDGLVSNGSTNVYEGLDLAYGLARKYYEPAKVNRLILCSDGVANNGASTEAEKILSLVRRSSDEGITISTIGFGMGNYNDVMMEKLANKGDGNYYYVDRQDEAERVFRENLTGMLQTIAREVKVQVEFDPARVDRWRLLGYENRDVADRDFRNDAVDAGEIGVGHQVTALYEVKLTLPAGEAADNPDLRLGTIRLRHEAPAHDTARAGQVEEIERPILLSDSADEFAAGTVWMRAQVVAAEFAEILRGSFWAKESSLTDLVPVADGLAAEMPGDPRVRDLADMIRRAADLEAASGADKED